MSSCLPDEGGICLGLLQATGLMWNQNSIGIINKKTSFDKLRTTYSGRSIAALWKTAAIRMQLSYELYLIGSCLPRRRRDLPGFATTNGFDVQAKTQ